MVIQSPVDQFSSWKNALISNLVGKNEDSIEQPEAKAPKLEFEIEEERYDSTEGSSTSERRDMRDESETEGDKQRTCIEDEKACSPIDERSCAPRSAEEMKMDFRNTQDALAEMVRKRDKIREIEDDLKKNEQMQCVDFSVSCNPEATASKEERKKPMMEREDDALDYVFNLVEIAICGDKKSNIDEAVAQKPTKKEQMPDPVQLLREKSIFQTLNPGSSSKTRRKSSRSHKSGESSDKSKVEDKCSCTFSNAEQEIAAPLTTFTKKSVEVSIFEASQNEGVRSVDSATNVSKEEVPKTEVSNASKPEAPYDESSMSQSTKICKAGEGGSVTAKPVSDVSIIHVPPTIPEEPSKSQESFTQEQAEDKKEVVETVPETDDIVSVAPQSSVHVDMLQPSISLITDIEDYSNSPPRVIHLSDSEVKAKPTKPSNIYSPNISKLQHNTRNLPSAVAAYNRKPKRGVNFGGSTLVVGKKGPTTTLAKRSDAVNEKIIQLLAGLLSTGHNNDPSTPRGVLLLATVVSFIFWPEGLPKDQVAHQTPSAAPAPVEERKEPVPSLLSLVGDAKSKGRPMSPKKRNRPTLQLSTKRMNASKKKSFYV